MNLSEIGERGIIDIFFKHFNNLRYEDASLIEVGNEYLVISTDMINERLHIPKEMTAYQVGKYVVNVNLSDIASMGARPIAFLASFGLRRDLDIRFVQELARGIKEACDEYGIYFLGGDTKETLEINISGIAIGFVEKDKVLLRSGARINDYICVTGRLGDAAMGYYCLINNIKIDKFIKKALEPKARVKEGLILKEFANACIDISDGLAFSLSEIARRSNVGFIIYEDKIPFDKEIVKLSNQLGIDYRDVIYYKGGDYELLFTIGKDKIEELKNHMEFTVIGEIKEKEFGMKVFRNNKIEDLEIKGWDSFKSSL